MTRQYLPEIDSLRAIAVVLVLLFHAYPATFPVGYLGVDMFFVISGYVISRSYLYPLVEQRKGLTDFYGARFRRLAPALFVTVIVTSAAAFSFLPPRELTAFANSLAAQVFYIQNFYFWAEGDYFVQPLQKPLLHTWSLAVEEQFYLLWGLLFLLNRRRPGLFWPLLFGLPVVSLALFVAFHVLGLSPRTEFYLLPTRLWQVGIGVIAFWLVSKAPRSGSPLVPWITLAATVIATAAGLFQMRGNVLSTLQVLAVCGGTAVALPLIDLQTRQQQTLSLAPVRYIGKISYSLYLWHWPIISLSAIWLRHELSTIEATCALAASAAFAVASYHLIETPIRKRRFIVTPAALARGVIAASSAILAVAILFVVTHGAMFRYAPQTRALLAADLDRAMPRCPFGQTLLHPSDVLCKVNKAEGPSAIVVMGDSHSDQYTDTLASLGDAHGVRVYFVVKNTWVLGHFGPSDWSRPQNLAALLDEAKARGAKDILSIGRWLPEMNDVARFEQNVAEVMARGFRLTVLEQGPVSEDLDPTWRALKAVADGRVSHAGTRTEEYRGQVAKLRIFFTGLADRFPDRFFTISPEKALCPAEECLFETNGRPNYFDSNHVTQTGAARVRPLFDSLFRRVAAGG